MNVACIGAGVIGCGWTARLILNGVNVRVFDPDKDTAQRVHHALANGERAYQALFGDARPRHGELTFANDLGEAVSNVRVVQENLPERIELKQQALREIDQHAAPSTLIASSTSGLLPTTLQQDLRHPDRLIVAHPYNPVYLLPLVELVPGRAQSAEHIDHARQFYSQLGMKPVVINKEIDAFVGDRLLEALWREALWLIKDDITTATDLDDIIRHSFGLRWAQMGLFETYRIAGGDKGMQHFLEQFGPSLQWPWSRLTDVPELDDALIEKISTQSDAQAEGRSVAELEEIRDNNLVAILKALSGAQNGQGWGAGQMLHQHANLLKPQD